MPVDYGYAVDTSVSLDLAQSYRSILDPTTALDLAQSYRYALDTTTTIRAESLSITTLTLADGAEGAAYSAPIETLGGSGSNYVWSVPYGTLPPGLALATPSTPDTVLSGTFSTDGTWTFTVRVTDDLGNVAEQAYTITAIAVAGVSVFPAQGTVRGGDLVVLAAAELVVDTSEDADLTGRVLPAGWSSAATSGGRVVPSVQGVRLQSTVQGTAQLIGPTIFGQGEITLEVLLAPTSGGRALLACGPLELTLFAGGARAALGALIPGGVSAVDTGGWVRLHLIRGAGQVWAAWSAVADDGAPPYLGPQRRLLLQAPDDVDVEDALTLTALEGAVVTARWMRVRASAAVDGVLLLRARAETPQRVVGLAPPTTADRAGVRAVSVFGLFGQVTDDRAFTYTLPVPLTLTRAPTVRLSAYGDPSLRNSGPRVPGPEGGE